MSSFSEQSMVVWGECGQIKGVEPSKANFHKEALKIVK